VSGGPRSVAESGLPSREVTVPCRVFSSEMLAPPLLRRFPSCPLPLRAGLQGLHPPGPGKQVNGSRILSWASAPLQRLPKHRAAALSLWSPRNPTPGHHAERQLAAPPLRFRPLQRLPSAGQRHELAGYAFPTACAYRFSQPPGAFIRPEPAGLVPCRIRSWGHPPEPSSSHAAVRCFQRLSPRGVPTAFRVLLRARVRFPVQLFKLKPST